MEYRIHGGDALPTLIYLPGVHGDWTLVASFRQAVAQRVRFIEFRYPRTSRWTLDDHAQAIHSALETAGVREGWLLAESFGSQIAWAMLGAQQRRDLPAFRCSGLILAGGFVQYPFPPLLTLAIRIATGLPEPGLRLLLSAYSRIARLRHRQAAETLEDITEFVRRRLTPGDREAIIHRLQLIAGYDPRPVAGMVAVPVWSLTGFWDPVVPWQPVRRWLRRNCPGWQEDRIVATADHTVLATQPGVAACVVLDWMRLGPTAETTATLDARSLR